MNRKQFITLLAGGKRANPPWYSAGSALDPDAAYQAIGAESIFASYTNLINPGTYDLAAGITPVFDKSYGWSFNGTDQFLQSLLVPDNDQTWSAIVRYSEQSGTGDRAVFGSLTSAANSGIVIIADKANTVSYRNGTTPMTVAPKQTTGVLCIAGDTAYRNGIAEPGTIGTGTGTLSKMVIGGVGYAGGSATWFCNVKIQAIAFYHAVLTAPQVLEITNAMNALTADSAPPSYISADYISFLYSSSIG